MRSSLYKLVSNEQSSTLFLLREGEWQQVAAYEEVANLGELISLGTEYPDAETEVNYYTVNL